MDMVLYNGNIFTADKGEKRAEAVAIKDGKITAVGTDEEVLGYKDSNTKLINLEGKTAVPGFNDSHMHLLSYAVSLEKADLNGTKSIDEMKERVKNYIKRNNIPEGRWVLGMGWNHSFFKEKRLPSRQDLDEISQNHPIVLTRTCGHLCAANTRALKEAGIFDNPPEIEGGGIDVDRNGVPTGILKEKAQDLVYKIIPPLNKREIKGLILKAAENCLKEGITSVQTDDFEAVKSDFKDVLGAYFELDREKRLKVRINEQCLLPEMEKIQAFINMGYKTGYGSEFFKIGPLKLLSDGSLGGRTAALRMPYADDETTTGILIFSQDELDRLVEMGHLNGLQVAVHAIGDRAMDMALESFEKALSKYPKEDPRFRIIHAQITTRDIIEKFKKLDVIADIQPIFVSTDLAVVEERIGKERAKWTYNWKTFIDYGVHVAGGSDCPVEPFNPLYGIYAAVTRKNLDGYPENGWLPEQKLTVEEALYIFTMGSAYASFEENIKGSITPGKLADIAVLSDNIFEIEPDGIKDVNVEKTIVDGEIVYEK